MNTYPDNGSSSKLHAAKPERFVRAVPSVPKLAPTVWINPPEKGEESPVAAQ